MINNVNLIAYIDRLTDGNINDIRQLLSGPLKGVFSGIHLLPFFDPIDGADAGFDPIDHTKVDPRLGDWDDIKELSNSIEITADIIVNHISSKSPKFLDYLENGDNSVYKDLFLRVDDIFDKDVDNALIEKIYRPRPGSPFSSYTRKDGVKELLWTTFTSDQIDINVYSENGQKYLDTILHTFHDAGIKLIRLDAAGYAVKKAGTNCFMIPETFEFIDELTQKAHSLGMEVLVEIHSYYQEQIEIAKRVDFVYDFVLPPLILHAIYRQTGEYLKKWLDISPRNAITVLDTHDGIGVIDIGANSKDPSLTGLIPNEDIDFLVNEMHNRTNGTSRLATGTAASNLDLYQVNSTYYDSLGKDDDLYVLSRAIQFFSPGIPQVYYMGLLGHENDIDLLTKTKVGRDINRHYFSKEELSIALDKPVVKRLIELIKYRNQSNAFNGDFHVNHANQILTMEWALGEEKESLIVNFNDFNWHIESKLNDERIKLLRP